MSDGNFPVYALNAGIVGQDALGRVDMAKMRMAAEEQTNIIPSVLGPAQFRPGTGYYASTRNNDAARLLPFVFNVATKALIELTATKARILLDGVPLTRPSVSAAVTNGDFTSDISGWTLDDEDGAATTWVSGSMQLLGTGYNYAQASQQLGVTETGTEHALNITIAHGAVMMKVGSTAGGDEYLSETQLRHGVHSIALTPTGDFYVSFRSKEAQPVNIDQVAIEAAGTVVFDTEWGLNSISALRFAQSGDVLFCAADGIQQRRIERRSQRSWSITFYDPEDGPFRSENFTSTTLTPSDTTGRITLTSSRPAFDDGHDGSLWQMTHYEQHQSAVLGGEDQWTEPVRVTGVVGTRVIGIGILGTFVGTVTLQQSFGEPGDWHDVPPSDDDAPAPYSGPWTAELTTAPDNEYEDSYDNAIVYYRAGFKAGEYTSGAASVALHVPSGIQTGIVRIVSVSSSTVAAADVIRPLGVNKATTLWAEGEWSLTRGFPGSVAFHDGRLWWGWRDRIYGSVSDAFESFDLGVEGDAGPIVRSIATGGFERIYWLLSNQRLLAGTGAQEVSIRSSSLDEPLTPTQFKAVSPSERGSADLQAVKIDSRAIFVQRSGKRIFELVADLQTQDFASRELTRLCPDIAEEGVTSIAVQRQPDTRIWFVMGDAGVALLTYEPADEVIAWSRLQMREGDWITSVAALPGELEDEIWCVVRRQVDGNTAHYVEKFGRTDEAQGSDMNKVADSHVVYSGSSTTSITGLDHLEGEDVIVWGDGEPLVTADAPLTVSGGAITLPSAVESAVIGLPYAGRFKSAKLAYAAKAGTSILQKKKVERLGLLMNNVGWKGVRFGRDFEHMTGLNAVYKGKPIDATDVLENYDHEAASFNGAWDTDSRVCFEITAPYPATFMGLVVSMTQNESMNFRRPPQGRDG